MRFTKMQGCGNDYVYVNGFTEKIRQEEKPDLVRRLSDRHFGIGGDGVIFINPSKEADFEMEMFNADGTRAEMCGNGIRCVGKFVFDKGLTDSEHITVVSAGKIKYLDLTVEKASGMQSDRGVVRKVRVNMGSPILDPVLIPVVAPESQEAPESQGAPESQRVPENQEAPESQEASVTQKAAGKMLVDAPILVDGREYRMTCVSMGNPHAVIFTEGVAGLDLEKTGPGFECHERFPKRTNTEFVEVADRRNVFMRVWERGTGETLACGTGACAVAVACVLNGLTENKITVRLLGGELEIEWDREKNLVYMTGPAVTVFEGEITCTN